MTKFKVTLKPSNQVVLVDSNTNLLEALREQEIYIKSSCGGHATCSDCICKIVSGEDNLESPPFEELKLLGNVFHITKERLLCQTKVVGDVIIDITKHDQTTDEERLRSKKKLAPKKAITKVRSQNDYAKIKEERYQERLKNNAKDLAWDKHWEKNPDASRPVALGGGKRPKFFDTDKAIEATKQELLEREHKKEFFKNKLEEKKNRSPFEQMNATAASKIENEIIETDEVENKEFKKFRKD